MRLTTDAESLIARLRKIPVSSRSFTLDTEIAERDFGLSRDALEAMAGAGLPYGGTSDDPLFAFVDLHYLGLRLGTAQTYLGVIKLWRRTLERLSRAPRTAVTVRYVPQLPNVDRAIIGEARMPGGRIHTLALQHNRTAAQLDVQVRATWPHLPTGIRNVLNDVGEIELCLLPTRHQGDCNAARAWGLSDCGTAACLIVDECRRAGYQARVVHGLMISLPFSFEHSWAEVGAGGEWVPVDPLVIVAMQRFGGLGGGRWRRDRPFGAMLLRVGLHQQASSLITSADGNVTASYLANVAYDRGRSGALVSGEMVGSRSRNADAHPPM
jgi:hypothetical protein